MHGNFITSFFPQDGLQPDVDYASSTSRPSTRSMARRRVGGDIWGDFNDRPEVMAVMEYFTKGEHLKTWLQPAAPSPRRRTSTCPGTARDRPWLGKILVNATSARFDGSDLMPGEVGSGSFWKEMTS